MSDPARCERCRRPWPNAAELSVSALVFPTLEPDWEIDFKVSLSQLYKESSRYIAQLARAVEQGKSVDEANNFLRWLQFSGVCRLLEQFAAFTVLGENYSLLRKQAAQLQTLCEPHLQGRGIKTNHSQSTVDEINGKLDDMLSRMASPTINPLPKD